MLYHTVLALCTLYVSQISYTTAQSSSDYYSFGPTASDPLEDTPTPSSIGYTPEDRKVVPYDAIPFQTDNATWGRGPQSGYNQCNATTAGPDSQCQTLIVNSIDDFCIWGLPILDTVSDQEAATVAWCTNGTAHGARQIPEGTIQGMVWLETPEYIQLTGVLNQTGVDLIANDTGGELDPVGDDYRGNPLGGLVYSTAFSQNGTYQQIMHWTQFIGSDTFCMRICLPGSYNGTVNCNHLYDRIGCNYNAPGTYEAGIFETCQGDVELPVGEYYTNGILTSFTQPAESVAITSIPYTPSLPVTSNCVSPTSPPAALAISSTSGVIASAAASIPARFRVKV